MSKFSDFIKNVSPFGKNSTTKNIITNAISTALGVAEDAAVFENRTHGQEFSDILNTESSNKVSINYITAESIVNQDARSKSGKLTSYASSDKNPMTIDVLANNMNGFKDERIYDARFGSDSPTENYVNDDLSDIYRFKMPTWGYSDFINERTVWLKHLSNGLDEPNWQFFRIFFDFDSYHGLLGGVLKGMSDGDYRAINSAATYLQTLSKDGKRYQVEKVSQRKEALIRFVRLLSNINTYSPWIFKGVSGLQNAGNAELTDITKEKTISLELNVDTVDWRIATLFSLYKYACFDEMTQREIIPDNLRKFDMTVVIFSAPIKYLHTPIINNTTGQWLRKNYKDIYSPNRDKAANMLSTKIISFHNCEIKTDTLGAYIPGTLSNETPFQLGKNSITIKYDRSYEHLFNEYELLFVGSDGMCSFESENSTLNVLSKTRDMIDLGHQMLTASEYYSVYQLNRTFGNGHNFVLGNLHGRIYKSFIDREDELAFSSSGVSNIMGYIKNKVKQLQPIKGINSALNSAYDYYEPSLQPSWESWGIPNSNGAGTVLSGYGKYAPHTEAYEEKLNRLIYGTNKTEANKKYESREQALNGVFRGRRNLKKNKV